MATQACYHARSNSFPSRQHPVVSQLDEHLRRLRSSQATSTTSISHKLNSLHDLHDCLDKLLQLPLTQQALAQDHHKKQIDELLDGSLRLFDVCSTAKDALLQTKECAQEIQSILRRRRGGDQIGLASMVKKYLTSRKVVKKTVHKVLSNLKDMESKHTSSSFNNDDENIAILSMLKEVEAVTITVFDSTLSFIFGSKARSKPWSLVSKLMHRKRVACEEEEACINDIANVDAAFNSLIGCKTSKSDNTAQIKNVQSELQNLELCIQDLEEGLECLFRHLIKVRVSILNIINH